MNVEKTITAENVFSDKIICAVTPETNMLNSSVSGTFSATVTLQRSFDNGSNWVDVKTFTAPEEGNVLDSESSVVYRIGVKTGEFTSGSISVRLSN